MNTLTIGTRGSALALWQAEWVAAELRRHHPDLNVRLQRIASAGDSEPNIPLAELGTKGVFTKTIEDALLDGRIDVAVHSLKDLGSVLPTGLTLAAIPPREDPRDALVLPLAQQGSLDTLPLGARVGTSAPRRRAQLLHLRPDLTLLDVRGNVDTRLRKLRDGQYDALVLAVAGLRRLRLDDAISAYIDTSTLLPAGGQGALGIETRANDTRVHALVSSLNDAATMACCTAERHMQEVLEGGCRVPIGALARLDGETLTLTGVVASEDGLLLVRDTIVGPAGAPAALGEQLARRLLAAGADTILQRVRAAG